MSESIRQRVRAAVSAVLYIDDEDLVDGDATDLRELGLDSVRFVLLIKQLGVERGTDLQARLAEDLTIAGWVRELGLRGDTER